MQSPPAARVGFFHMAPLTVDAPDLDATTALGRRLGGLLFPGAVVALVGPKGPSNMPPPCGRLFECPGRAAA